MHRIASIHATGTNGTRPACPLNCFDTPVPGRFKVMKVTKNARRVWQRAIALNDKETVTGVQTLRCCGVAVAHA